MTLSCECGDWYPEPGDWWFSDVSEYTTIREHAPKRTRRVRCCSCKDLIGLCDVVVAFQRDKVPYTEVEVAIYGEEGGVPMATWYQCERCADRYFSLAALGYCEQPGADQRELVKEYAEMQKTFTQNRLAGVNQPSG